MSKIDLNDIDTVKGANEGFDVSLYHPGTNEDLGIVITVYGKDSDKFQDISRKQNKKRMAKLTKGGFRAQNLTPSPEEIEADGIALLAACTKGWKTQAVKDREGNITEPMKDTILISGKDMPFTEENAITVYGRFPWIKEQVDIAIGDRANFI
jgi:hypothetical protein